MPKYASLMTLADRDVQNAQELASIWGELETELDQHEATLEESYAILGEYDFLVIFEADDREAGFKSALAMHRHGLEGQTMPIIDVENISQLVDEI